MKKLIAAGVTAVAFVATPAFAQTAPVDPAAAQAVKDLLVSMKYREQMTSALQSVLKNIPAMILQTATNAINGNTKLTDAQKKEALDKVAQNIPKAVESAKVVLSDPKLIDDIIDEIVPLYARHFTAGELHQLADFYQSPLGAKMLVTMPQIMSESMQIGQKLLAPRIARQIEAATAQPAK